jgi:hypothetical protein
MRAFYPLLLLLPTGCGPADKPVAETTAVHSPAAPAISSVRPVFDIPALAHQNIDQIRTTLGKVNGPDTEPSREEVQSGIVEWGKQFRRDSTTLLVTYEVKTRRVVDFFITSTHGRTADYVPLLQLANVKPDDPHWSIEPFPMPGNPHRYIGVRVAAK